MILCFDTETSGKADFRALASAKHQPHLVQLGAQLIGDDWKVRGEINLIVKPEGWIIPDEAASVHGITTEIATKFGVPIWTVLSAFNELSKSATVFVAHNIQFDALIMAVAGARCTDARGTYAHLQDGFCTMHATTQLCKLPGQYGDYKWPKLIEAYQHLFGESFEGAHDALADVRACARIYKWIKTEGAPIKGVEGVSEQ